MKKSLRALMTLLLFFSIMGSAVIVNAEETATNEPFKAVAKIRTFVLDNDENLSELGMGSGIVISSSGLLLTNHHVIEVTSTFDNSPMDGVYLICLPETTVNEPDCSYTAKYIGSDKNLDIALMQIEAIPGLSTRTVFPYLNLSLTDTANVNDVITAIGYPDIGGSSVTTTQGVISGKIEKYGKQWIKTDAVISFGSSGGAAINSSNQVIGVTSAGHSDLLGSLGYIINISSLNTWINDNKTKTSSSLVLTNKMRSYASKEKILNQSNVYENASPHFTLTKPSEWEFYRTTENQLYVSNPADEEGGGIEIVLHKEPYLVDINSVVPFLRRIANQTGADSIFKINENTTLKIGNVNAKKIRYTDVTGQNSIYVVPIRNYLMLISYGYGTDDKDKEAIEAVIQSLNVVKQTNAFVELKKYIHNNPYFSFTVDRDWVMKKMYNKADPVIILNKKNRDVYISIDIRKTDDTTRRMNQDALLKHYNEIMNSFNQTAGGTVDLKIEYSEASAHFKTGAQFTDVIKGLTTMKSKSSNKIVGYEYGYTKKLDDNYILNISMYYNGTDKKALATYRSEFARLMKNFSIKSTSAKKDSDKDGLNDDDEKIYKTNPNKKDTDGDGFSDWEEIKNGYNPLGKGKLKK